MIAVVHGRILPARNSIDRLLIWLYRPVSASSSAGAG
jgi:hypothetical protein